MRKHAFLYWTIISLLLTAVFSLSLPGKDSSSSWQALLLPGETTHGHHQIELQCGACHTPWMGVKETACTDCHQKELDASRDTHPKSKFDDPTKADLLKKLDARSCLTCHKEHVPDQTHAMGVTLPLDYCSYCHDDIATERPSHKDFSFQSCSTAGCHNYHDNTALYEKFLADHLHEPDLLEKAVVLSRSRSSQKSPLTASQHDAPQDILLDQTILLDWAETAHAQAGINCLDCHQSISAANDKAEKRWTDRVDHQVCQKCHTSQVAGFLEGLHGMRLAAGLSPMTPGQAELPMRSHALHAELDCNACHTGHRFDTQLAAVDACLNCHKDNHSTAYSHTSHYQAWQDELSGRAPAGSGVSCATCHMPRTTGDDGLVRVEHNQNRTLEPNEKMIRTVCMSCHGLGFAIDSLADTSLIQRCFDRPPAVHVESLDLVAARLKAREDAKRQRNAASSP